MQGRSQDLNNGPGPGPGPGGGGLSDQVARARGAPKKVFSHAPILNRSATALCSARALSVS